jgi:hypothetical protein
MERRQAVRRRNSRAGTIAYSGIKVDCLVQNMSETGAALEFESPPGIPFTFSLAVQSDKRISCCYVVWRLNNRIGVVFG